MPEPTQINLNFKDLGEFLAGAIALADLGRADLTSNVQKMFEHGFKSGAFERAFPGFNLMDGCDQGLYKHLEGDVLTHTREVVLAVVERIAKRQDSKLLEPESRELLLLAALIHDIEKPSTREEPDIGKVVFPGHEAKAGERVPEIATVLELSDQQTERLRYLVAHHGDFYTLSELDLDRKHKLFSNPDFDLALIFYECDCQAFWESRDGSKRRVPATVEILAEKERALAGGT